MARVWAGCLIASHFLWQARAGAIIHVDHRDDLLLAGQKTRLDVRVRYGAELAAPWEELLVKHSRKIHLYAVHEVRHACQSCCT
jgi:hypothetical protein